MTNNFEEFRIGVLGCVLRRMIWFERKVRRRRRRLT
jgi:hypothetical protein